ncbi:MAG: tRNA pseudouridine(38-40) synthase TruA [Ferruginibacter sp.]
MSRYFIELSYKGTAYAGFQIQQNANSVQAEVENAMKVYYRQPFVLTGSSRTDAGVHALQNFFHFDTDTIVEDASYHLNAILPRDIVIKRIFSVPEDMHARFSATGRHYRYFIYRQKNPFLEDRGYYFPFPLDMDLLNQAAAILLEYADFTSFSKRNTQTKTKLCAIKISNWSLEGDTMMYTVAANRFLRGMVRGLVGTMLQAGRGRISLEQFREIIEARDCTKADFSAPAQGLFLSKVDY